MKDLNLGVLIDAGLVDKDITEECDGLCRQMTFDQLLDLAFKDAREIILSKNNGEPMKICEFLRVPGAGEGLRKCAKVILDLRFGKTGHKNDLEEFMQYRSNSSERQYAIEDGYDNVIYSLVHEMSKTPSVKMVFKSEVMSADYSRRHCVQISCKKVGIDRTETFFAHAVLFTSPSLHKILFTPALPHIHQEMINKTLLQKCVPAMKSVLRFEECFWQK